MSTEPIHSGHFMTSNPHTEIQAEDEDEDVEVDVVDVDDSVNVPTAEKRHTQVRVQDEKPMTFYKFGPHKAQSIAIDVSLNKLNKCIKVAYMKMTTPKWKDFKGLKLQWKHRIRLNNVIWRAYYMEFRKPDKRKKTPYCYFAVPDDDMTHTKSECSVLEGMYWKRRREGVCAQYKRWRTYNRHAKRRPRGCCRKRENSCGCEPNLRLGNGGLALPPQSRTPQHLVSDDFYLDDDFDNVFTDRLFESLDGPFLFPNPKDGMQTGNADIMQPGLLSLQPSIEEIMSIDYCSGGDGLAAFIDRVSREPPGSTEDSPGVVSTPQQPTQRAASTSQYGVDGSPATTSSGQPPAQPRVGFLAPTAAGGQSLKYLLTTADTNNNSNGGSRGDGNAPVSQFRGKNISETIGTPLQYTAKEYDAANMLINYSSQKPQDQLFGSGTRYAPPTPRCEAETRQPLVQVHTPQPLYSQAFYSVTNDPLPVCAGANNNLNQQRQFALFTPQPQPQPQPTVPSTMPATFENLQSPSQQQQLPLQQQQIQLSVHNNRVYFSSAASPAAAAPSPAAVLTLDQYVLAAAVAASSASVVASGSSSSSGSSTHSVLNSLGGFNARATQQLLQQPQWWLQSSQSQQNPQSQPQLQLSTQNTGETAQLSPHEVIPSYDAVQFLRSAQIQNYNNNTTQQQQQQFNRQQQKQQQSLNKLPLTTTTTTTSVLSILQSAQQQQRAASTLPQLLNAGDMLLGARDSQALSQPTANDLSRYLPTNIGISAPSLTVSTASVSLPSMFYASPATNASVSRLSACQPVASPSTGLYERPTPRYTGDSAASSSRDSSATILQFHQQCQQQQQQQQQTNTMAYGGVATVSPPPAVQPLAGFKVADKTKPSFSKPYPMKKYSQPNPEPIDTTPQQTQRPSSSDVYGLDNGGAPNAAKMARRSNRSESTGMDNRLHHHEAYASNDSNSAPITRTASDASSAAGGWIYDRPLTLHSPHSAQQPIQQQQQQMLFPHGDYNGAAPLSLARQRHASMSAATSAPSTSTKALLIGQRSERAPTPPAATLFAPPPRRSVGKRSYANFGAAVTAADGLTAATVVEAKPMDLPADSNGSPILTAGEFGSNVYDTDGAAVKEEQEDRSPIGGLLSQQEPTLSRIKGAVSKRQRSLNGPVASNTAPADSTLHPEERKRILHLHAEKNRRSALKDGFDALVDAIPYVEQAGVKSTNAVVLNRAAVHIRDLRTTAEERAAQVDALKQKIAQLNERISFRLIQSNLPTTSRASTTSTTSGGGGAKSASSMRGQIEQFAERYTKERSKRDYRFWLMSEIFAPIVRSYAAGVHADGAAREAVAESARRWLDAEWNAAALRPLASDTLVRVATASGVFTNDGPDTLPKYILGEIAKLS